MILLIKRLFDVAVASLLIVVLSPLLTIIYLLVYFKIGAPVIFKQSRGGLNGTVFTIYKFRTMQELRDFQGQLLPDKDRLTPFGKHLRAFHLDELPQLFNVVRGDLSLVGPRPLLTEYLTKYSREQARRHEVRPGLTGWAQINGKNSIKWEEKFALDIWYVDNQSLFLDLKIILLTLSNVLRKKDIHHEGFSTMPVFQGTMKNMVIIGAGGQGREIAETIDLINSYKHTFQLLGFVDDNETLRGKEVASLPVLGTINILGSLGNDNLYAICAIGNPLIKQKVIERAKEVAPELRYVSIIHPVAMISPTSKIGEGAYIGPQAVVSCDSVIGKHALINYGCTIGHDAKISDYVSVLPGTNISGNVSINTGSSIGSGSVVIPNVTVGEWAIVGAGAAVINSLPPYSTSIGIPAKVIKQGSLVKEKKE